MLWVFRGVLFTSITCLLSACADYRIARPTTERGRSCAAACDSSRAMCDREAQTEASLKTDGCDSGKQSPEQACSRQAGSTDDRCIAAQMPQTQSCHNFAPNYGPCTSDWELCVLSCGGRMIDSR